MPIIGSRACRRFSPWRAIAGRFLAGDTEGRSLDFIWKGFGGRGIVKVYDKEEIKRVLGWPHDVLAFPGTNFCFEQGEVS